MPDHSAMERYLGRCVGLVVRLHGVVPAVALDEAQHLIDHGEPAEGIRTLAWAIADHGVQVPRDVITDIRDLTSDLIAREDMPTDLDRWADG